MNGVINFLKPPGMSSNGAVVFLRGLLGVRKTGHAGTLDPGACGVLPICVGKATKISSYMMGGTKEYIAEITFGKRTDTADSYGAVIETSTLPLPDKHQLMDVLGGFCGDIIQQTPAYSAVKHNGRKLYQLARAGIEIAPKMRDVRIDDIVYIAQTRPRRAPHPCTVRQRHVYPYAVRRHWQSTGHRRIYVFSCTVRMRRFGHCSQHHSG